MGDQRRAKILPWPDFPYKHSTTKYQTWFASAGTPIARPDGLESPCDEQAHPSLDHTFSIASEMPKKILLGGMPHVVNANNRTVYINCSSAITAMGISALMKRDYPGYQGQLVSSKALEELKKQLET